MKTTQQLFLSQCDHQGRILEMHVKN